MKLSTFDGNHAFLFEAELQEDKTLVGDFYSGKDWYESWTGFKNENAELPSPDSLTYLKKDIITSTLASQIWRVKQ